MSDKTDSRRYRCCGHCQPSPNGGCGDMWGGPKDSHEVACPHGCNESLPPGIVRVDTSDEALVEWLVDVAAESLRSGCPVPMCRGTHRADARLVVRAVLAALAGGDQ